MDSVVFDNPDVLFECLGGRSEVKVFLNPQEEGDEVVYLERGNAGFTYAYDKRNEWIDVFKTVNVLTIIAHPNPNKERRYATISVTSNMTGNVNYINVTQNGVVCAVNLSRNSLSFDIVPLKDGNIPVLSVTKTVNVEVYGASSDFYVQSVEMFTSDGDKVDYDGNLRLEKVSVNNNLALTVTSFGRTAPVNGTYYIIKVAHKDDTSKTASLKVTYGNYTPVTEVTV